MDDKVTKAQELLEERLKRRRANGHPMQSTARDDRGEAVESRSEEGQAPRSGAESAEGRGMASRSEEESSSRSDTEAAPQSGAGDLRKDLQRLAADFANYRKRNEADRAEFAKYAKADLIAKLLDVLDGYDRALATVPEELRSQPWVEGMWLVERKLRQILENEGLQQVDSLGKPFDPYVHEAVAHVESDEPEGTIVAEYQKAYRLHDRVIRPALVAVAKQRDAADGGGRDPADRTRGVSSKEQGNG